MPDSTSSNRPLTDQALARLRKLAEGNGLPPDKITLIDSSEQIYVLEGMTQLVPFCDQSSARYAGPVRGQERTMVGDIAALHEAAEKHQKSFIESREWLTAAKTELEAAPGNGWGLDGAKISLPDKSAIFAANETCTTCEGHRTLTCNQCQGQGVVVCTYCEGRGLELCYNCSGRGVNPAHPNQSCAVCFGKRYAPCRFCYHSSGKLVCPTCLGKRSTSCPNCQGQGRFTTEIGLACGATMHFRFGGKDLPSGMRRGLDRLGVANLVKGHADVKLLSTDTDKDKPNEKRPGDPKSDEPVVIRYEATMPYADLKVKFGDMRAVMINVFGKRGSLMGVPPFLDEALKPFRERLQRAARGQAALENALDARLMQDALKLTLTGQGQINNLRRLYSVGLTPKTGQEILNNMRAALRRTTRHIRLASAFGFGLLSVALLAGFILMPFHAKVANAFAAWQVGIVIDVLVLLAVMAISWIGIGKSVQIKMRQKFPNLKIALHGNVGNIGISTLIALFVAWAGLSLITPSRPDWIAHLLAKILR